jgi:hypothetical protein
VALPEERPSSVGSDEAVALRAVAGVPVDRMATEPPQAPESFDAAAGVRTDPTLNPAWNRIESGDYAVATRAHLRERRARSPDPGDGLLWLRDRLRPRHAHHAVAVFFEQRLALGVILACEL